MSKTAKEFMRIQKYKRKVKKRKHNRNSGKIVENSSIIHANSGMKKRVEKRKELNLNPGSEK